MGKLIEISHYQKSPFWILPKIEPEHEQIINKMRAKFGNIEGFEFLYAYIGLVKKGRNILCPENLQNNTIPSNIEYHISRLNKGQSDFLVQEISAIIKQIINVKLKEQLLHLRNNIINKHQTFL